MRLKVNIVVVCCILILGCVDNSEDLISLDVGEPYTLDLNIYGDEEGAFIVEQAQYFSRSEIVRDSSTNWGAYYYYVPDVEYIGLDFVRIETCTGRNGTLCNEITIVELRFNIKE